MFKKRDFWMLDMWWEREDEEKEGRGGYWFLVNTTFLYCSTDWLLMSCSMSSFAFSWQVARLASATPGCLAATRASLMLGTAQWEAKGTVGLWKSMRGLFRTSDDCVWFLCEAAGLLNKFTQWNKKLVCVIFFKSQKSDLYLMLSIYQIFSNLSWQ